MSQMPTVRVYAERDLLILALQRIIEGRYRCDICSFDAEISAAETPDIIVIDFAADPGLLMSQIVESFPQTPIVAWQRSDAREPSLNALQLGARGILHDSSSSADVVD